jgi:hypothetical protein
MSLKISIFNIFNYKTALSLSLMNKFYLNIIVSLVFITVACSCLKSTLPVNNFKAESYSDSIYNNTWANIPNFSGGQRPFSLALKDGRRLWFFQESNIYEPNTSLISCNYNAHNALLVQNNNNIKLLNAPNQSYIPDNSGYFHPLSAYNFQDTIFVYCQKYFNNKLLPNPFLVKLSYTNLNILAIDSLATQSGILFNYSLIVDSTFGFIYSYGLQYPFSASNNVFVSRQSLGSPYTPHTYYNGSEFTSDITTAKPITTTFNQDISIAKIKSGFIFISQDTNVACNNAMAIYAQFMSYVYGDVKYAYKIFDIPNKIGETIAQTNHVTIIPTIINANNEVLLTYSINDFGKCESKCINGIINPIYKNTKGLRVKLSSLFAGW